MTKVNVALIGSGNIGTDLMVKALRSAQLAPVWMPTGVYSSFLLFAQRAAQKYGVSARDILVEMGRRKAVGGQEDLIEEVALELRQSAREVKPVAAFSA